MGGSLLSEHPRRRVTAGSLPSPRRAALLRAGGAGAAWRWQLQPSVCCRTRHGHFPSLPEARSPCPGSAPPGGLSPARSWGTAACFTPRNAVPRALPLLTAPWEGLSNQLPEAVRDPSTTPSTLCPPRPKPASHFPPPPKKNNPQTAANRKGLQQQDSAFRLFPGCGIWFALNQSKRPAPQAGGAPRPPTLLSPLLRL